MQNDSFLYERLKQLAVEDPREARKVFLAVFAANGPELSDLLIRLRNPDDGRLRQVIANAVRQQPSKARLVNELLSWRESETDEFTRRAIEGALLDVNTSSFRESSANATPAVQSALGDVYRYVSDRLRHRLRNTMLSVQTQSSRLKRTIDSSNDSELLQILGRLDDAIISMGRDLEATNVDPEHFRLREIVLDDWVEQFHTRYSLRYPSIDLRFTGPPHPKARVRANDYLLETIFWNLWANAHQAVGENCQIAVSIGRSNQRVELLITDNGAGFPYDLKDVVFQQVYSTKEQGRGRGMMEVQDAVERLGGSIELRSVETENCRIRLSLPAEEA